MVKAGVGNLDWAKGWMMREREPDPIRVLLVDASALTLALLKRVLAPVALMQVVGGVRSGHEALALLEKADPHVVCVGLQVLDMEAPALVRMVMDRHPRPVLVVGASALREGDAVAIFQLFEAGALDLYLEPLGWRSEDVGQFSRELTGKIRLLARLDTLPDFACDSINTALPLAPLSDVGMLVMGVGLGGISALRDILAALPMTFPVPILCIVHLHPVLQPLLSQWLGSVTPMPVQSATHGEIPMPGSVYLAPVGQHLFVDTHGRLATLSASAPSAPSCYAQRGDVPSIAVAMESVASFLGPSVIGVLLSGTGEDGARGLELIARAGGYTLAMDEASALVFDLPARLLEMGTVRHLLPCSVIARALLALVGCGGVDHTCGPEEDPLLLSTARDANPQLSPNRDASPSAEAAWRANEGILIVEDSPTQAFKLKRFLQESGFLVAVAKDGLDGLERARQLQPRLILSDVSMPRMDGFELCRTLKQDPLCRHIPVMLLTALTNPEEILEGLSVGADNYLTKPWEGDYLLACLQQVLATSASMTAVERAQVEEGIELSFAGRRYTITSSRRQVLDLLLSTYQKAVRQNKELMDNHLELKMLNSRLVDQAARLEMGNQALQLEITERKKMEAAQAVTLSELSAANRELGDFAYIISHDLKAPSRAIGSLTSWLLTDYANALGEEGRNLVELLQGRADRLNGLIDALLQYVRVTRLNETLQDVELNHLVSQVIKGIKPPEEMEVVVENRLPTIRFEPRRAEQLFHSLIENAVRFMDKPLGVVRIACVGGVLTADGIEERGEGHLSSFQTGAWWQFRVSDNGPGIESTYFEKIFGVFQTLQARDEQETSGMGLALARKIVHKFGGRIWVVSQVGKGSTFCFTLPKNP